MFKTKRVVGLIGAAALAAGVLLAQAPAAHGERGEHFKQFLAGQLGLPDAQKAQAKEIFSAARDQAKPLTDQLRQGHEAMTAAVKANRPDSELDQLAQKQGALMGQLSAIHAKAFAKFYAMLTPEQQAKADKLHEQFRGMLRHRFGGVGSGEGR